MSTPGEVLRALAAHPERLPTDLRDLLDLAHWPVPTLVQAAADMEALVEWMRPWAAHYGVPPWCWAPRVGARQDLMATVWSAPRDATGQLITLEVGEAMEHLNLRCGGFYTVKRTERLEGGEHAALTTTREGFAEPLVRLRAAGFDVALYRLGGAWELGYARGGPDCPSLRFG